MIITPAALSALMIGFKKNFQDGLDAPELHWMKVATLVPGTGKSTTYGWLGKWPKLREWVGDRVFNDLQAQSYAIINKKFESSVAVGRDDIEDDEIGVFGPMFKEMGQAAAEHPEEIIFALLGAGFASECYDGQNFFDPEHPVYPNVDGTGTAGLVSNMQAGSETPWFLLDTSRALKPLIYQERRKMEFESMTAKKDSESVWLRDEYQFGVDGRNNAGFGFWQMAHGSQKALTPANLWAAHEAMRSVKGDGDKKLNIKPRMLVVPTSLEKAATEILDKEKLANGESNTLYKKYELVVADFL